MSASPLVPRVAPLIEQGPVVRIAGRLVVLWRRTDTGALLLTAELQRALLDVWHRDHLTIDQRRLALANAWTTIRHAHWKAA